MTMDVREHLQTTLGDAYTLERELGGGGMSRVFVAEEMALGRRVVVKVLAHDLAEGLSAERFKREVRLAARLQHPHIVPLLAAGALADGRLFYTMPFVEGEGLDGRLAREGALPVAEAVGLLREVASALAYAHRHQVVHRDVKPANVLVSDGRAVVTDFGIAKAIRAARDGASGGGAIEGAPSARSGTITQLGTSVGTPQYMAPEQAAGDSVDHRADLYALGVVAYELLAGRPPFAGRTAQQLLAAHATEAPEPIGRRRTAVPAALAALVMRLLEKNPADRPQSAADVLRALEGLADATLDPVGPGIARRRLSRVATAALALGATAVGGAMLGRWVEHSSKAPNRPVTAVVGAPAGLELRPDAGVALSPDGTRLALVATDARGGTAVWVRPLDSLAAARVTGTDGGAGAFWSPDGASLGFFAGGQLRVVDLRGGPSRVLCPAPRPGGGTWTKSGVIVYSPAYGSAPLFRVQATGGRCAPLTRLLAGGTGHRSPSALPDGRVLFYASPSGGVATTQVVDLSTGAVSEVARAGTDMQFAAPNWLISRQQLGGPLYAQELNLRTLRPKGERHLILDRVSAFRSFSSYTIDGRALIAHQSASGARPLLWVDRQSSVVDSVPAPPDFGSAFGTISAGMSGDGRRIVFAASGVSTWLHDRTRNVGTRILAEQNVLDPVWGPGDSLVAYRTILGTGMLRLYHVGTGTSDSLFAIGRRAVRTPHWAPDGRRIAFELSAEDAATSDEIWVYSLAERRAARAWAGSGNMSAPRWSPEGRWIAYVSDETGTPEVYVRPGSGDGVAGRVSTAGGEVPRWRADGRELYYRAPDGAIMAVDVLLDTSAVLSSPRVAVASPPFSRTTRAFDVTSDGKSFVAFRREDPPVFTLVLDWAARLASP